VNCVIPPRSLGGQTRRRAAHGRCLARRGVDDLAKADAGKLGELPADAGCIADHGRDVDVLEQLAVTVGEMGDATFERQQVTFALRGELGVATMTLPSVNAVAARAG